MRAPSRSRLLAGAAAGLVLLVSACTGGAFVGNDGSRGGVNCPGFPTAVPTAATSGSCTWSYTPPPPSTTTTAPTSTTTAPATTTTTVPPTTTTTTSSTPPPTGGFPTPATAGYPAGQAFTLHSGDMTITQSGTYSGLHVTGELIVNAPNVTITNSWIEGIGGNEGLDNENTALGSGRMSVSYTTIGNASLKCNPQPGLGEHDYTADHVKIVGMGDGFRVSGSNVTVTNSFVQTCDDPNNHDDGVQVFCPAQDLPQPCQNVVLDHNTLSNANTRNFTAPVFGGSDPGGSNGQLANSKITNNMLWGGVFTIFTAGKNLTITGNRLATNRWTMPDGSGCESNSTGVSTPSGCSYAGWVWGASAVSQSGSTCALQNVTWNDNLAVTKDNNWQVDTTSPQVTLACK